MNLRNIIFLPIAISLISGCDGTNAQDKSSNSGVTSSSAPQQDPSSNVKDTKPWSGSAEGYVSDARTSERVKVLIVLGRLLATADIYSNKARNIQSSIKNGSTTTDMGQADLSAVFNQELLTSYAEVEDDVQVKSAEQNQTLSIREAITALIQPEQISDISNPQYSQRDKRIAAEDKILSLLNRLDLAVLAYFPSRHEFLLASSALIRDAGDITARAVSADGTILDADLLQQARSLIDKSEKLNPNDISYCDAQRVPMREHKDAINDLLNNLLVRNLGEKISVTASGVYALAKQTQQAGERLPVKDSDAC